MVNSVYGDENDAGVMLGDIIVNVNGTSVMSLDKKSIYEQFKKPKNNLSLTLIRKNKKITRVVKPLPLI
jgi:C-terminal processing protease CtpA/Prc